MKFALVHTIALSLSLVSATEPDDTYSFALLEEDFSMPMSLSLSLMSNNQLVAAELQGESSGKKKKKGKSTKIPTARPTASPTNIPTASPTTPPPSPTPDYASPITRPPIPPSRSPLTLPPIPISPKPTF